MNPSLSRVAFEQATGYNEVPKSAQDLLDLNSWPMWNIAWSKAFTSVDPRVKEELEGFISTVDFEAQNLDAQHTPGVLIGAVQKIRLFLDVIEV
jgi:hypothetical protein